MKIKEKVAVVLPFILVFLFVVIVALYLENSYDKDILQSNLMWITPVFFGATLGAIIISGILSVRHVKKLFIIDRRVWILVVLIFVLGTYLRVSVAPNTHRLYYDEDIYLNIGQNIAKEGRTILCNYGNRQKCVEGIYNKQPNGYPFLMSFIFFGGGEEREAHYATAYSGYPITKRLEYLRRNGYIPEDGTIG